MQEVSPKERSWGRGVPHSVTIKGQLFNLFQNQKMCLVPSEASRLQPLPPPGAGVVAGALSSGASRAQSTQPRPASRPGGFGRDTRAQANSETCSAAPELSLRAGTRSTCRAPYSGPNPCTPPLPGEKAVTGAPARLGWPDQAGSRTARPPHPTPLPKRIPSQAFFRGLQEPSTLTGARFRNPDYLPFRPPSSPSLFRPHLVTPRSLASFRGALGLEGGSPCAPPALQQVRSLVTPTPRPPRLGGSKDLRHRSGLGGGSRPGSPEPRRNARLTL